MVQLKVDVDLGKRLRKALEEQAKAAPKSHL